MSGSWARAVKDKKKNKYVVNNKAILVANMFLVEISLRLIGRDNDIYFLKSLANLSHRLVNLKPQI